MNIIKNLGDLKKALSVYPDDLPVVFKGEGREYEVNCDQLIAHVRDPICDGGKQRLEVSLFEPFDLGRLTHKDVMDRWLPWDGGKCPVDSNLKVDVRFKNGEQSFGVAAGVWKWGLDQGTHCIIAYRVSQLSL